MPAILPEADMEAARAAVEFAQSVRKVHRRKTDRASKQRHKDIELALERLREAMQPLRHHIGRFPYGPQTDIAEENRQAIRDASQAIQAERRKLWKMRPKQPKEVT